CTGMKDGVVHATYYADSRSGTPSADNYKVKGNIHWVSARRAHRAEVRLYDRLFTAPEPGAARDFVADVNPDSITVVQAELEPSLGAAKPEERFQFERHGYFVRDRGGGFNRTVTLRDSWKK
ncbi:MAG: glutamine--tRNA ligase, partial [Betaproteobacteria bacterium]